MMGRGGSYRLTSMITIDLETTKNQARQLLNFPTESVTELVIARKRADELSKQLGEAEREDKKVYVRATRDGKSEDELKKLGLNNNAAAKRRSRRSKISGSQSWTGQTTALAPAQ